ncbi:MAG: CoA transferase [Acidimicrobiia bacterium]
MQGNPPLADSFVVVDLTEGIAGAYVTKILVDAGADVIKVEAPSGDPLRGRSPSGMPVDREIGGPLARYLNAGKASVVADCDTDDGLGFVHDLVRGADAVVWREGSYLCRHPDLSPESLRTLNPRALVLAMTPFGIDSPWRHRPANQFTLQAMSGGPFLRGQADLSPFVVGGNHGDYTEATLAVLGLLLARWRWHQTGRGELIDAAALDAMQLTHTMFPETLWDIVHRPYRAKRTEGLPGIHPTKDNWVGFWVTTGQQWLDFCSMVGRQDWLDDQSLLFMDNRAMRSSELTSIIDEWTLERTTAEIEELAAAFRIPVSPIARGDSADQIQHYVERGFFTRNEHTGLAHPEVWYEMSSSCGRAPFGPAPKLGEHTEAIKAAMPSPKMVPPADPRTDEVSLPFEGLRVADMTAYWAGPIITHFFALFGADVIHLESTIRPDGIRSAATVPLSQDYWWETSPFFIATNTNKRDLAVDMSKPDGRQVALDLLATCDVFIENFSPRVVGHLGIDYPDVTKVRSDIVMVRAPAFGIKGPWRDRVGYAPTVDQGSGLSWLTGPPDHRPMIGGAPSDSVGGLHGAIATLLALEHRRRTGEGALVESPQIRPGLSVMAEQFVEYSATGVVLNRIGNRSYDHAPQGAYRARDADHGDMPDDDWIALTVESDAQWRALCQLLGRADLAADAALAHVAGRQAQHERIDEAISAWSCDLGADAAVIGLLAAGIPAAHFVIPHERQELEPVVARNLYEWVDQPHVGRVRIIGFPVRFESGPEAWHRTPSPTLGQHNIEILRDLLGYDAARVEVLESTGIVGTKAEVNLGW